MFIIFPFFIIIVVFGLIAALAIYSWQKDKERTLVLQKTAGQLGWSFMATAPLNMIPGLERFALFNQGHGKQIKNFMYGEATGIKAAVVDYIYVTGSGKNRLPSSPPHQPLPPPAPLGPLLSGVGLRLGGRVTPYRLPA